LLPLINEPAREWPYPAITGWLKNSFAVQTERHRYIRYGDGSEELYDHQSDLKEWTNLATKPETAALRRELTGHLVKMGVFPQAALPTPPAKPAEVSPAP
jgi:hypothetical protein